MFEVNGLDSPKIENAHKFRLKNVVPILKIFFGQYSSNNIHIKYLINIKFHT